MIIALFVAAACGAQAQRVTDFRLAGPYAVSKPYVQDSVSASGQKFTDDMLLDAISHDAPATATFTGDVLPATEHGQSVGVLSFYINNGSYVTGTVKVETAAKYKLYVDGTETDGTLKLAPEHHTIALKYLTTADRDDSLSVTVDASQSLAVTTDDAHPYTVHDLVDGRRVRAASLSADGAYVVVTCQTTARGGDSQWSYELRDVKSGRLVSRLSQKVEWMPRTCAYIEDVHEGSRRMLYAVSPATGERTLIADGVPEGNYVMSPTEDYLIVSADDEGQKEDEQVFQVLEMDDRQPGWRSRSYLVRYDMKSHVSQRITFGNRNQTLIDITPDGRRLLIASVYSRLTQRPTTLMDIYTLDVETLAADTLIAGDGYLSVAQFSPDGRKLLVRASPEAFGRIGCQLPDSVTPNMMENELFLFDVATKQVTPLTRDFDPSVETYCWSPVDDMVYFSAEDRDYVRMYRMNPRTGDIQQLPFDGDYTYRWDMATQATAMAYVAYDTMQPASAYVCSWKPKGSVLKEKDFAIKKKLFDGRDALGTATVGTCRDWNFLSERGDSVYGRLYLPADFDASKKYPMIVYYYGGCSPVSRYFESPYAPQMWCSLGYVAYILQPGGATGFGQEWASRHVNTAGRGPADDIIEGVKRICDEHPFINRERVGCMGASYGGFMTQYLQTVTDIFACAVSHAGIANHTSYWGEGYWGYNYSEVSMANSYPWSHRELYVDRSPLFNADKIHTPLLLLHGTADTNVPIIESLQMFTALKLLGREVALVEVEGENHHILDYTKKLKWIATQMAWFQRWLKDDASWWDALYPEKHL